MSSGRSRIERERKTVRIMVEMYCRDRHGGGEGLCRDCRELLAYSEARLDKCPFHGSKPTCAKCLIHCYSPAMRERIKVIMRYSGPRLMRSHPFLAVGHLLDGLRKPKRKP
ncbi:MAG: nitrous oxide-stimulated promoter family protein [Elusimicrobiota bacterium]